MKYIFYSPQSKIKINLPETIDESFDFKTFHLSEFEQAQYRIVTEPGFTSAHQISVECTIRVKYRGQLVCDYEAVQKTDLFSRKTQGVRDTLTDILIFGFRSIKTDFRILTWDTDLDEISLQTDEGALSGWEEKIAQAVDLIESSW
jgi:hypothetical protein